MSAIAHFTLLPRRFLDELATSPDLLREHGRAVPEEYGYSGQLVPVVLEFLDDRGVDLYGPQVADLPEGYVLLLLPEQRPLLPLLDAAARTTDDEFRDFLVDWTEDDTWDAAVAGQLGRDTVTYLRDRLAALPDDQVVVVQVG